ncbi:MAG: hypothetical protein HY543_12180 [Deltaproteobacteria bacterium]|nr:hypothetical protein [Deltaproteobacteria bacterium]
MTALLLTVLVLPGAGHWYLGRKRAGSLFAAWAIVALCYPLIRYARALANALQMLATATPDLIGSAVSALHTAWQTEATHLYLGFGLALACWILAAVDVVKRP